MPQPSRAPARRVRTTDVEEMFARQRTATEDLPDPVPLLHSLTRGVLEVLAGVRDVGQLARWLSEEPYRTLMVRANLATRARSAKGQRATHPAYGIHSVRSSSPADGVIEAVIVVTTPVRTRAVAMRLEGIDRRWRATSLAIL